MIIWKYESLFILIHISINLKFLLNFEYNIKIQYQNELK